MKKVLILITFVWLIALFRLSAQTYFSNILHTPYPFVGAILGSIETPDSGFILMHTSFDIFQDTNKINIVKINRYGETVWKKSYGATGTAHEQYHIIRTRDSNYVFCGGEWKDSIYSAFLFKMNENGDSIWLRTYNEGFYLCFFNHIVQTEDGSFVCAGGGDGTPPNGANPWRQQYIVKTDEEGNLLWQKKYGSKVINDNLSDIIETPEHDFICVGYLRNPYSGPGFYVNAQIFKIDSKGELKWVKIYGEIEYWQFFSRIKRTMDGNYLLGGGYKNNRYVLPSDPSGGGCILQKMDGDGNVLWFRRYGDEVLDAECQDFVELPDSSLVMVGYNHFPQEDSKMVKMNSRGEIKWLRVYKYNTVLDISEALFTILHTKDNGFLLTGYGTPEDFSNPIVIGKGWWSKWTVKAARCRCACCQRRSRKKKRKHP
jgi:hypothetical protein